MCEGSSKCPGPSYEGLLNGAVATLRQDKSDKLCRPDGIGACSDAKRSKRLLDVAYQSWQAGLYTDVTLVVGKQRFSAHRLVLASMSDYFPPLFKLDERETGEVTLHSIEPEDFSVLLKYAYTGEVDINKDNAQSILIAADYLSVNHVKKVCVNFMAANLDSDNMCDALMFATDYALPELEQSALKFLRDNLDEVSRTSKFSQLDPKSLVPIFEDDNLILYTNRTILKSVEREKLVFTAVLRYLSGRSDLEPQLVEMMVRTVRLSEMPKDVIKKCLKNFKSLKKDSVVKKYVKLRDVAAKYLHDRKQDYSLATVIGKEAEELPEAWFRRRKLAAFVISQGRTRYAAGGQVGRCPNPPRYLYNDFNLEIKRIDIWLRRWDGRPVIGGLSLIYRRPFSDGQDLEYMRGERNQTEHYGVELEPNEFITKVIIGSGWLVDRLGFETNTGRVYGPYGGPGGSEHAEVAPSGSLSYLFDINCDTVSTQGSEAIFNLMLRWITFE